MRSEYNSKFHRYIEIVFGTMMVFGFLMVVSSIPVWLNTHFILTPFVLLVLGIGTVVAAVIDRSSYRRRLWEELDGFKQSKT